MECTALSGSVLGSGLSALRSEKELMRRAWNWKPLGFSSSGKCRTQGEEVNTLRVRAVSTPSRPASSDRRARRPQNVDGEFFVDRTCIDCDTCRWMAPTVYSRKDGQSAVHHQPTSAEERTKALQALLACPTASIRTVNAPKDIRDVHATFPLPIDPELPGVYHSGYHSEKSFAATSYFITRPEGNILVDSPKYTETLAKQIDAMGGVRYMFLTHKDDVADHKKWRARFKCEGIIHKDEVTSRTTDVEIKLEGEGNWTLGSDVELIFTPGHTEGHVCLFLKDIGVIFSGDHLGESESGSGEIEVDRVHNWYSVPLQIDSVELLLKYDFTWLLPGHGRRHKFQSVEEKNAVLREVVEKERRR